MLRLPFQGVVIVIVVVVVIVIVIVTAAEVVAKTSSECVSLRCLPTWEVDALRVQGAIEILSLGVRLHQV